MPERMLARTEAACGAFAAEMLGLEDDELDVVPQPGEWTARQVIDHVISVQGRLLKEILAARERKQVSERQ
jgi:hypothetical protein